jgi:molecular chaperone DnaK
VHVLQGEREVATANKSLGRFDLSDIPSASRGVPQIEVTFDIDANGILNVSAKDKATGKEQKIVIKASSGLSDDEVDAMIKDAEAHAEEDRKHRETVEVRNQADAMIHSAEKTVKDLSEQIEDEDKANIESAIDDLKKALEGTDKDEIEAKTQAVAEASSKLAEKAYSANPEEEAGGPDPVDANASAESNASEDVVDAEFEEVKEDDKK